MAAADDVVTVMEGVARALVASNLELKEGRCSLDYILALGAAAREVPGCAEVLHLQLAATPEALSSAMRAAVQMTRKLDNRRGWELSRQSIVKVARIALLHYINPICPKCLGTRYEKAPGAPMLTDRICRPCYGTGRRPLPTHNGKQIAEVITSLQRIEFVAENIIKGRLRRG